MGAVFLFLGGYFFYFLTKQLTMGFIFAVYSRRVVQLGFGVSPNMAANMDGYWGLRYLRHFIQTTYGSTLGHFIMVVGILACWLPFGGFGILMVTLVMIINALVVIYPSIIASTGTVMEKKATWPMWSPRGTLRQSGTPWSIRCGQHLTCRSTSGAP
jgi:hypothetical protein